MNSREVNFAYKLRHALNENLDTLPTSTALRLAEARQAALTRRKQAPRLRALAVRGVPVAAGGVSGRLQSWLGTLAAALPALALAIGLAGIYNVEQQRRIDETAAMDAEMLADDLPLSAYLDHGFNAFLATQGE